LHTKIMPRLFVLVTYGLSIVLLLSPSLNLWLTLIFPGWVFVLSVYLLILNFRTTATQEIDAMTSEPEPGAQSTPR
jgi:hypothetical protein